MMIGTTNVDEERERQLEQRLHRRGITEHEADGRQHHGQDVQEAEDVPREVRPPATLAVGPRQEDQEQRGGRGHVVPPAPRHGEGPGQLAPRVEGEEVEAHEAVT